jgi:hypothetical protein
MSSSDIDTLISLIDEHDLDIGDIVSLVNREISNRKRLSSLEGTVAYQIYQSLLSVSCPWEVYGYDGGVGIYMEEWDPSLWTFLEGESIDDDNIHVFDAPPSTVDDLIEILDIALSPKVMYNVSHISSV